jgi:hypothetical protein
MAPSLTQPSSKVSWSRPNRSRASLLLGGLRTHIEKLLEVVLVEGAQILASPLRPEVSYDLQVQYVPVATVQVKKGAPDVKDPRLESERIEPGNAYHRRLQTVPGNH